MLTFFTTAKPFPGHDGVIQRNALKSWTLLHPEVEVILFGDEEGAAETARELGLRHEPHVERNEFGTKRLDFMFLPGAGHRAAQAALLHQLRHLADAGFLRCRGAGSGEAFTLPDGGAPLGYRNHCTAELWKQGLRGAIAPSSIAQRAPARDAVD